jgi:purine nucleosidase
MGGGYFEGGNITPAAEFNIYVDPHAAKKVFESGIPITMMSLDVTHQALTSRARVAAIKAIGSKVSDATVGWLDFFERFDVEKYGSEGGPLHDPCVVAWLLRPDLFSGRDCNVEVETISELTMGMTVIDWWGVTNRAKNAHVVGEIDAEGFFTLIAQAIARL